MPIYKMDGKKDGKQKYRVRINYVDNTGKSRQIDRVAYGKEEAKDLEHELMSNLKEETMPKMTLRQLYDEYVAVKSHEVRASSLKKIKLRISHYVLPFIGGIRIDKLNVPILQKWKLQIEDVRLERTGKPLELSTKKNIYGGLGALLNYAVKMEYIEKNPLAIVGNFKNPYEEKKEMDYYTPEEFKAFITAAKHQAEDAELVRDNIYEWNFYVFFNIAFYTGMRKGEIHALKWTDIDGDVLRVRRSINQKADGGDLETPPKNKSSVRDLQIPKPLADVLKAHYARHSSLSGFTDDWRICGGTKCLRNTTLQSRNEQYAKEAGLKVIRIHDFRHSHATLLANNGINIQEIARRLGHSKVETTWNTYAHLYPREEERAVQVLNKIRVKNV